MREFFGPLFPEKCKPLRKYAKEGADFTAYAADAEAQASRTWLIETLLEQVVLVTPDWEAAARPYESGRPFELYLDASDVAWAAVLCQRDSPGGTPRVIGMVARSFEDVATRWSAFEREFFTWKEGVAATSKWTEGLVVFTFFDHENIERAESVLKNRRATKKLMAWVAETQDTLANTPRVWIAGKANVLADAGSRAPWQSHVASHLAIPVTSARPFRDFIEKLFAHPDDLPQKIEQRRRDMGLEPWAAAPPDRGAQQRDDAQFVTGPFDGCPAPPPEPAEPPPAPRQPPWFAGAAPVVEEPPLAPAVRRAPPRPPGGHAGVDEAQPAAAAPPRPPGGHAGVDEAQPAAAAPPRLPGGHAGADEVQQPAAEAPDRPDGRDIPVPSTPS